MSSPDPDARPPAARTSAVPQDGRLAGLRDLIPEAFRDGSLETDALAEALGLAAPSKERFGLTWTGKTDAVSLIGMPSLGALVPEREESTDFDNSGNVFIEGDNVEVLKLLYKAYFGRVKVIYLDPPYNTGRDFVYTDSYAEPLEHYLRASGQKDEVGNLLTSNPETSGRFHSAWLSMMYPRLWLARQLLRADGVLFISIDDNEVHNLRLLLNEVFGEENFLASFVRRRRMATAMRDEPISPDHEYVLTYARSASEVALFGVGRDEASYPFEDGGGRYRSTDLTVGMTKEMRPNQWYALRNPRTSTEYSPPEGRVWRFQPSTMEEHVAQDDIIWPEDQVGRRLTRPRFKTRFEPTHATARVAPLSTWMNTRESEQDDEDNALVAGLNQAGTKELRALFGGEQLVEYPKPVSLLTAVLKLSTSERGDDLVMDFFAGSCTTADAVLRLNREDGGSRRFVMVQLPEPTPEGSTAHNAGYATVADIGKERIRRVIASLNDEVGSQLDLQTRDAPEDLGFRVFTLTTSSLARWTELETEDEAEYTKQMELLADGLADGWTVEDVLWEVALKEGFGLNSRVSTVDDVTGLTVYRVDDFDLEQSILVCLDDKVELEALRPLALTHDTVLVCRDAALNDTVAANLALQTRLRTI